MLAWASLVVFLVVFLYVGVPLIHGRLARLMLRRKAVKSKAIVLTFDDGPSSRLTPAIVAVLAKFNVKATFFLIGKDVVGRESIVRQIEASGHEICSHGYYHLNYLKISPFRAVSDIKSGWKAINHALGKRESIYPFRPPYGKLNIICLLYLWIRKVPIFYWTLASSDTWPVDKRDINRTALLASRRQGAVVIAHDFDRSDDDINKIVVDSIRLALLAAKKMDMRVMTLSELMEYKRTD